ncbi:hypothetical protein GO755_15085 [Spirosoma sp. HMF4905]|uniref:DUF1440 domain-containing protein n=1 Tax=Spirosoma arboris TaxID=2682092 RepID=A0A7K1SC35_9BACT|nr:hypothetical protein [Spirosoma arboris]MVM31367.1 hypothetical protein [Spirosoma arboris]
MVILVTGLIAGSLDFGAALLLFVSLSKQKPSLLLRYITSAALGPRAFSGGSGMVLLGLCFHYLIALWWTALYFAVFPRLFPCGTAVLTNAVVYGMFVWVIMNLVILPLSKAEPRPFSPLMAMINIFILIIAIGLPCAYAAKLYPLSGL